MLLVPEEEEKQLPAEPPIHTEVLPMVDDLDSHHTEVGRVVVAVVVPRLVVVVVVAVVVPRLALVLVDTHADQRTGLHMHEEEEDTADGMAGILPPVRSLRRRHRHHSNILEVAAEADNGT